MNAVPASLAEKELAHERIFYRKQVGFQDFFETWSVGLSGMKFFSRVELHRAAATLLGGEEVELSILGVGDRALAGRFRNRQAGDLVLKLTFDLDDLRASRKILGLDLPGVVRIARAGAFSIPPPWEKAGLIISAYAGAGFWDGPDGEDLDQIVIETARDSGVPGVMTDSGMDQGREGKKVAQRVHQRLVKRLTRDPRGDFHQVAQILKTLAAQGVYPCDPHSGNLVRSADGLTLVDLGTSWTEPAPLLDFPTPSLGDALAEFF